MEPVENSLEENKGFADFIEKYTDAMTKMIVPAKKSKMFPINNTRALKQFWSMKAENEPEYKDVPVLLDRLESSFEKACSQATLEEIETALEKTKTTIGELSGKVSLANKTISENNLGHRAAVGNDPEAARDYRDANSECEQIIGECEAQLIVYEEVKKSLSNLYDIKKDDKPHKM